MEEDAVTLRILRGLSAALPLLALPFIPAFGNAAANLVVMAVLHHIALQ